MLVPFGDVDRDGRRPSPARRRSVAPRALRRALARARLGVGLRAVGGGLRRSLPRSDRLAVDLLLVGGHSLPRRPPRRRYAPGRKRAAQLFVAEHLTQRARHCRCRVGDDERLPFLEEACDAAPVRDDDRRSSRQLPPRRPCRSSRRPTAGRGRPPRRTGGGAARPSRRACVRGRSALAPREPGRLRRGDRPARRARDARPSARALPRADDRSPCRRRYAPRRARSAPPRGCRARPAARRESQASTSGSGNPLPRTRTRSTRTPPSRRCPASRSELTTTAAAPPATPRYSVASSARFSATLRRRGSNIPSGSKTYGMRRSRAHAATPVDTGVAKAEHVHDVGPFQPLEGDRKRRRDAHPAVADRRREVRRRARRRASPCATSPRPASGGRRASSSRPRRRGRAPPAARSALA